MLFAYGSNLAAEEVAPEARFLGVALLHDSELACTRRSIRWGGGAIDVVPAPGGRVWGGAFEPRTRCWRRSTARRVPASPTGAARWRSSWPGEVSPALTYEVIDKDPGAPPATPEYASLWCARRPERGLPEHWLASLEAVLTGAASVPVR